MGDTPVYGCIGARAKEIVLLEFLLCQDHTFAQSTHYSVMITIFTTYHA